MGVELAVSNGRGDVDGPVAGTIDVGAAPALEGLIGTDLVTKIVQLAACRDKLIAELVFEPLAVEITLVAGNPLMQPHVRGNNKFSHSLPPVGSARYGIRARGRLACQSSRVETRRQLGGNRFDCFRAVRPLPGFSGNPGCDPIDVCKERSS